MPILKMYISLGPFSCIGITFAILVALVLDPFRYSVKK